ncbi:alpha-(1,4)-fucosyltransferase [Rutidosis leptorrhynchoides]|uniref:alpha-(1,4)-fucosyltransferase n=1 Tax=Rutidosis leptorrhynchoides TaxID=125765 RepID=UPI003A991689
MMLLNLKPLNSIAIAIMLGFSLIIFFCYILIDFPSATTSSIPVSTSQIKSQPQSVPQSDPDPFQYLLGTFKKWDSQVGCSNFKQKHMGLMRKGGNFSSLQVGDEHECSELKMNHVGLLIKGWTWIPDNLDNLYSCRCGLSCLWTKSSVLVDKPDALFFETSTPPSKRRTGDPLRVYMDLEAGRRRSGFEDIFISYHAEDDVQSTYAGGLFHNSRNYYLSPYKNNDTLIYWSSSRCLPQRNQLAKSILSKLPHHSFGKCLNNVGGLDKALSLYPECVKDPNASPKWWDHLHCAMSHYKFVLAIENTYTESYVTEKLFYALDSGAIPIYFGAPNVMDFVPPHSIIDGTKFKSIDELVEYVKALANDPIGYAEYHAWRRCGVLGNYGVTRAASLDTLPCRLCEAVSRRGGRDATA